MTTAVAGEPAAGAETAPVELRIDRVTKRFDDVVAVDGISLDVERGRFYALLGPSGCGKTTTLRMIGGFEQPDEGRILLGDREVTALPPYKRDVNTVFQSYALFPHLSVFDNVAFGLRRRGLDRDTVRGRVRSILSKVQLDAHERRKPRQLSGGQQQRVALARALVNSPKVLLLDEPLGALDLKLRKEMQLELKALQHDLGITFVHVTHDQEEAMTMADAIAVMNGGHIEQLGAPTDLYERPKTRFVAGFLGISNLLEGHVGGRGEVRLHDGTIVRVPPESLPDGGPLAVGIRPEKIRIGGDGANQLSGSVAQRAYIGVSTEYLVDTALGRVIVYVQNDNPDAANLAQGSTVSLTWSPESTFVVEPAEEKR